MAIEAFQAGQVSSLREAARLYDVNANTIKNRLQDKPKLRERSWH